MAIKRPPRKDLATGLVLSPDRRSLESTEASKYRSIAGYIIDYARSKKTPKLYRRTFITTAFEWYFHVAQKGEPA